MMTGFDTTAGLKLTSSKMQFVELRYKSGKLFVQDINEIYFNEKINFAKDKETKISALLQGAYDEILLQNPVKDISISISVPQNLIYSMQVPFEESLLYTDLIEQFRWELSLLYPFLDSRELFIQYYPLKKTEYNTRTTAYVTALPRNYFKIFSEFCKTNNLYLRFVDSAHTASDKALSANKDITGDKLLLSLMIDEKILSFIFYSNGDPFLLRSYAFTNASEIPQLVRNEFEKNGFNEPVSNAYISGDELSGPFIDMLSEKTGITFSTFNPFSQLQLDAGIRDNRFYLQKNSSFSPAVGISIRSF